MESFTSKKWSSRKIIGPYYLPCYHPLKKSLLGLETNSPTPVLLGPFFSLTPRMIATILIQDGVELRRHLHAEKEWTSFFGGVGPMYMFYIHVYIYIWKNVFVAKFYLKIASSTLKSLLFWCWETVDGFVLPRCSVLCEAFGQFFLEGWLTIHHSVIQNGLGSSLNERRLGEHSNNNGGIQHYSDFRVHRSQTKRFFFCFVSWKGSIKA